LEEESCKIDKSRNGTFDDGGGKISALEIGVLCNNAVVRSSEADSLGQKMLGDPLEIALLRAGMDLGLDRDLLVKNLPRLDEIPFSSERKYMATLHKLSAGKNIIFIKGAPEKILEFAVKFRCNGSNEYLKDEDKKTIFKKIDEFAGKGERIITLAYKNIESPEIKMLNHDEGVLFGATFVGFISFKDPLRKDIEEVVRRGLKAGVRPVIITGDYLKTAVSLSREAGIKAEEENVMEGPECLRMPDKEFADCVKKINVFARIEPNEKMRIVKTLRKNGEVVAMVGDGVNDAPSLKSADIGVSLGTGTDVTKQTADMVLLDNNFKTIISAIRQGRLIFDNIRKVVVFALSDAFCEIILLAGSIIFHTPLPFFPAQILWVNIIEDSFPNIALGFDKEENDLLKEKPRKKNEPILNAEMKVLVFVVGIVTDVLLFGLFYYLWKTTDDLAYARTMVFAGLAIDTLFYVFAIRTLHKPVWGRNPFGNKFLTGAVLLGFIMVGAGLYLPPLRVLLRTIPLGIHDWLILIPLGLINIILIELVKGIFFFAHRKRKRIFARKKTADGQV
jgi:Ca2+-transporting ATPase